VATRVKLCAIAKNEGPYLADWVFHHLHLGFDAVEVWVNGSDDGSLRILRRIAERHPEVTCRRADRLLAQCLESGDVFQHRAYRRMARAARAEGFTHAAFLDLDEYWTPRDLRSPVHDFLPDDPDVNVVSFPWCVDVPDPAREPFTSPLDGEVRVQLDRHVKSAVRLDGSVHKFHAHTGRTRRGTRLLVREPFPVVDIRAQGGGSFVTEDHRVAHWGELPEAFVLHAVNRSQREYVASLLKGLRQAGEDTEFKINRFGFQPSEAPTLTLRPGSAALRSYWQARRSFLAEVGTDGLTRRAQERALDRAAGLLERLRGDAGLMTLLGGALRGISEPTLDAAHPGWDARVRWWVDAVEARVDRTTVVGWAFSVPVGTSLAFALRDGSGRDWMDLVVRTTSRPEVRAEHGEAPLECGFEIDVPAELADEVSALQLRVQARGASTWESIRLARLVSTPSTTG